MRTLSALTKWLFLCICMAFALPGASVARQVDMGDTYITRPGTFEFAIYCNEDSVPFSDTNNTITVSLWNGDEFLSMDTHVPSDCDDKGYGFIPVRYGDRSSFKTNEGMQGQTLHQPSHAIIETSGEDAFFIDYMNFSQHTARDETDKFDPKQRRIGRWGVEGGEGWCLLRDPRDHDNDGWKDATPACYSAMKVDFTTKEITPARPTNRHAYQVVFDCGHSDLEDTGTPFDLKITLYDDNERVLATQIKEGPNDPAGPLYDCDVDESQSLFHIGRSQWDRLNSQFEFIGGKSVVGEVAFFNIEILLEEHVGPMGFYNDPVDMANSSLYIDQIQIYHNKTLAEQWGGNDGKGWCISNYSKGGNLSVKSHLKFTYDIFIVAIKHLSAGSNCFRGVTFDIASGKTFFLD